MKLSHWFLPHQDTHKKAKLISWHALFIYVLLFILLQVGFSIVSYVQPGVLGISGNIEQKRLIELTNAERQKKGLPPVSENSSLDQAAALKAQNMLSENYWAHFAPSGKTPWDFILGSGYKFTYAGENLAKNFYNSDDVVVAWMNSPTHRDNLLNPKYQDIGIAVVEGVLNGQQTTLVVQMFGTSQVSTQQIASQSTPQPAPTKVLVSGQEIEVPKKDLDKPLLIASANVSKTSPQLLLDPYSVSKTAGLLVILVITVLLGLDLIVLRRRGVLRITSHHMAHMAILSVTAASLLVSSPGNIL